MKVKELLKLLASKKQVMITRNGVILALHTPEYLLNICDSRTWGDMEIDEIIERTDDILIRLK